MTHHSTTSGRVRPLAGHNRAEIHGVDRPTRTTHHRRLPAPAALAVIFFR